MISSNVSNFIFDITVLFRNKLDIKLYIVIY